MHLYSENKAQKLMEEGPLFWASRHLGGVYYLKELWECNSLYLKMWSSNQQHWHHMGALWKG